MSGEAYDESYFLRGQELGISGYTNYRWLAHLTRPMVASMVQHLGIEPSDSILDFGCARGYVVRAFREMGYAAWGYDISQWALKNCDETVREFLVSDTSLFVPGTVDWVIAKDVLEHVSSSELYPTIERLKSTAKKGIFVVVPLAHGQEYDVPEYEKDITHIHRRPLQWWCGYFHKPGWSVEARYRVKGVKDNYAGFPTGNGFIVARRLAE